MTTFISRLSGSQVAKEANFKLQPLRAVSLPASESSLTSPLSSLAWKARSGSSFPPPASFLSSACAPPPHLGAERNHIRIPLSLSLCPPPQSPSSAFLLFFLDFPSESSLHSHSKARWLIFWSIHISPLLTYNCWKPIIRTSLVTRFLPQQAAWWDLASEQRVGKEKLSKGKSANILVAHRLYFIHLEHLESIGSA